MKLVCSESADRSRQCLNVCRRSSSRLYQLNFNSKHLRSCLITPSLLCCRGLLLQESNKFSEALHYYKLAIGSRPTLACKYSSSFLLTVSGSCGCAAAFRQRWTKTAVLWREEMDPRSLGWERFRHSSAALWLELASVCVHISSRR